MKAMLIDKALTKESSFIKKNCENTIIQKKVQACLSKEWAKNRFNNYTLSFCTIFRLNVDSIYTSISKGHENNKGRFKLVLLN